MIRIDETEDGHYIVRMPKEVADGLSVASFNQIRKMSYPQMRTYMVAVYAAAVYEKRDDATEIEMDWDEEVIPAIQRCLDLDDETTEWLKGAVQHEVAQVPRY